MASRQYDDGGRLGRRQGDRRASLAESPRILLVGRDEGWRLLHAVLFEEAGYTVYAAGDSGQGAAFASRLLPDVVMVQVPTRDALDLMTLLTEQSITFDIPVVTFGSSVDASDAQRMRAAGAVTLGEDRLEMHQLVSAVESLIVEGPRKRRALRRRLLDLQELARYYRPDPAGQARMREFIDHLQVAVMAVDEHGHCIATSEGARTLTGYSDLQLLTMSVFDAVMAGRLSGERWQVFLANRQYAGTTTLTTCGGARVMVHAAAVAEVMPGVHLAAFARCDRADQRFAGGPKEALMFRRDFEDRTRA